MPSFVTAGRLRAGALNAALVRCDGHDPARAEVERVDEHQVWIVVAGRFAWRGRRGRAVADPATALLLPAGETFEVRHPPSGGGDLCLSVRGEVAGRLIAEAEAGPRPLPLATFARIAALAAGLRERRPVDPLAVEEALAGVAGGDGGRPQVRRRDRDIAEAIAHALHLRFDEPVGLAELAAAAGVSVFHACRVFRRVTGTSIHQHRKALRVRHAIALLLDSPAPLAAVAAECGFANQAHMTTELRRAIGLTPARLRAAGLPRLQVGSPASAAG